MKPALNLVDAHVHWWDPQSLRYPWLETVPALQRAFLPEDFAAATAPAAVTKMVFVEAGCAAGQALDEVRWGEALALREPRLRGIVAAAPLENEAESCRVLQQLSRRPLVKGVRRLLQAEPDPAFCLRPEFVAGVRRLAEYGFSFDLCLRAEQLPAVTELVRRVPEVHFVLDHCGKPPVARGDLEPWATWLKVLAESPNVCCKLSGLTTEADWQGWQPEQLRPYLETALAAFGFDRVLFGGDWPVCTLATNYARWVAVVDALSAAAPEESRRKLFQFNAERVYRI